MRKIGCLLALLVGGCAHEGTTATPDESLAQAYDAVASGAKAEARAAGYLIERAGDKGVRVVREAPIGGLGRDVTDAWITTKVKTKLATDKDVIFRSVHADT